MSLYIIGNGFDLAHGLNISYGDFRCYLEKYEEDFFVDFEKYNEILPQNFDDYYFSHNRCNDDAVKDVGEQR